MFSFTTYTKSEVKQMLDAASRTTRDIKPTQTSLAQKKLIEVSKHIYLFSGINNEDVIAITNDVQFMEYAKDEVIFKEGDQSDDIYFLLRGFLSVEVGREQKQVARISPMELFGEMAFISKKPRNATIRALEDKSTVIKFVVDDDAYESATSFAFMKLYKNIATIVVKKLEASNEIIAGMRAEAE